MKIVKYGHVIITATQIRVEGWLMEREPTDPPEATPNELVAALAADWALKRLADQVQKESVAALIRAGQRMKAANAESN